MNHSEIVQLALNEGFCAASVIPMDKVVFDQSFLRYCEDNLCGGYGANYSCPPDCGSPTEMESRLKHFRNALVVQTKWPITDYTDTTAIRAAKVSHNQGMMRIIEALNQEGHSGIMAGSSSCTLCSRCAILDQEPCKIPDKRFSCLSAYCIFVKQLAEDCGMEYFCTDGGIALFGLYAF